MAAAPFKLYGEPYSVSTLPVIFTAVEGGVPYELQVVHLDHGEHLKPEFRAINPMHCVPTMDDGGFILWEGRAIAKYLCGQYNLPDHFYPKDVKKRAVCDMALDFHQGVFYPKITFKVLYPACGWGVPESTPAELKEAEEALHADIWPSMQRIISINGGGPLMGGEKPNLADFFFATHIMAIKTKLPDSFVAKHEGLIAYLNAVKPQCPNWDKYIDAGYFEFFPPVTA